MAPGFLVQATTLPFVTSPNIIWHSPHVIPFYASIISGAILLLHEGLRLRRNTKPVSNSPSQDEDEERIGHENHATAHGGGCGRVIEVLTLVGSLELLRVSWLRVLALPDNSELVFSVIAFVYTSLLALSTLVYPRSTPSHHITFVLSTTFIVYFIRDVLPLTTYTRSPSDSQYHLWELIIVLSITGILLPLLKPHYHVSPDPNIANANPEQTASPLSLLLFSFLDHTVWKASKLPKLPISELPPLANSDRTNHLVELAFPHLDPLSKSKSNPQSHAKKRSIFLSIATTFYKEIILMAILLSFQTLSTLTTPYGLKRLLEYLETNGEGASVKPWVWIASLFLAPFTSTLLAQQYQRTLNRLFIHLEAILTQLVLKHSLRIRINVVGQEEESTTTGTGSSNKSLIGRMNNLISSDLQSISRGSEFLQMVFAPLMVLLCIGFLYTILGWSALVGFAVMLSMMPIPVQVTKILSGSSKELSARSDDRVEAVTETLTVIRMIKLFGWEHKMSQRIEEKRRGELKWVWWNKLYGLLTLVFQFIIPAVTIRYRLLFHNSYVHHPSSSSSSTYLPPNTPSHPVFDLVRSKMYQFFTWLPMIIRAKVSLQRIGSFLSETELLDEFESSEGRRRVQDNVDHAKKIGFKAASFTWSKDNTETTTTTTTTTAPAPSPTSTSTSTSRRSFKLQIDDELLFHRGSINLILGPTGEMHFTPTTPNSDSDSDSDSDSWFNLPRTGTSTSSGGGVAYAAQESWVLNASIKDNILFGAPFDEERYNKDQCFLTRDLELLPAGDLTEVGEKGLTLSGGQKVWDFPPVLSRVD
ncbi:hypothetical protein H0H93_009573 [Arthromyces matolae]|nr:hypothetical protein H0H93_009573 [Arthromyces matolae]